MRSDFTTLLLGGRCLIGNSWPGLLQMSDGCWVCAEHSQPPWIPAHFASGLTSLALGWVLCKNRDEFTEKSRVPPPFPFTPTQHWPSVPALELYPQSSLPVFIQKQSLHSNSQTIWYLSLYVLSLCLHYRLLVMFKLSQTILQLCSLCPFLTLTKDT